MHPMITIKDKDGNVVWFKTLEVDPEEKGGKVAYSADVIGTGQLVYGHFGTYEDLSVLERTLKLAGSVVIVRMSRRHHVGSMVRNAEAFGAKAVVLFPDVTMLNETGTWYNLRACYLMRKKEIPNQYIIYEAKAN